MRQCQRRLSCGVDMAANCTRLPPTPALASTAARAAAQAGGLGVLHLQRSPIRFLPIELLDRCLGPSNRPLFGAAEGTRTPGAAVNHDRGRHDAAGLGEHQTKPLGCRRKSQAADQELLGHVTPLSDLPPSSTVTGTRKTV